MRKLAVSSALVLFANLAFAQSLDPGITDLTLTRLVNNLDSPTSAIYLPDGKLIILEQGGDVLVWTGAGAPTVAGTFPVTETAGEQGLLGVAVDPMFATSNRLYFYYSQDGSPTTNRNRVAYAIFDPANNTVDVANRTDIVINIRGPANHDGGGIVFGPDNNLYIGVGDTGCNCGFRGCGPGEADNFYGTCLTNPNGKILRVDRDGNIPATNPLVGLAAVPACGNTCAAGFDVNDTGLPREDIYNWGFRNPWRFAFDSQSGFLWIGDVGEISYEEITVSKGPGEHHGWPWREGAHGDDPATSCTNATPQASGPCVDPVIEYNHSEQPGGGSGSITGGIFSNHCSWPAAYHGRYWFGDYAKNRVWNHEVNGTRDGVVNAKNTIVRNAAGPVHFFEGLDGSINYVAHNGAIWSIAPMNPVSCGDDAGVPPDMGVPGFPDAEPQDNGAVVDDTGVVQADAEQFDGLIGDEAGVPVEAGVPGPDAGMAGTGGEEDDGCGCSSASSAGVSFSLMMILISGLAALRVRRGRR